MQAGNYHPEEIADGVRESERRNRLKNGTRVITTTENHNVNDWTDEARANRRWGVEGVVITHHDSHGLCYDVVHDDDGTTGSYDPTEIKVI